MKELRRRFHRFCLRNRNWGIPNLMLWVCLGAGLVYLISLSTHTTFLYEYLDFDRKLILQGQVWRLVSYPFTYFSSQGPVMTLILLVCYYSLGKAVEQTWGTLRFNLFYFCGIFLMDAFCMIFGGSASVFTLHLSLLLAYATLFPDAQFIVFFIIPVRAWILGLIYLVVISAEVISLSIPVMLFPYNLFPLISLGNYFLFFGRNIVNLIPISWRVRKRRPARRHTAAKVVPFPGKRESGAAPAANAPYTHRCAVCGRTDVSDPGLEFRYCSRCNGYHCYCEEHINSHSHVQ